MIKCKKYFCLIIFVGFLLQINAQDAGGLFTLDIEDLYIAANVETFDLRTKEIEYNTQITEDWTQADVITNNDLVIDKYLIKYDPLAKKLFLKEGMDVLAIPPTYIKAFILKSDQGNRFFEKFNLSNPGLEFLELLVKDQISLYLRYETSYLKSNYNPILDAGNYNDKVVLKEKYYLFINGLLEEIPTNKKKLKEYFISKDKKLRSYFKANKSNLKKESDLIKILNFLNKK